MSKLSLDQVKVARRCEHLVAHRAEDMEDTRRHQRLCIAAARPGGFLAVSASELQAEWFPSLKTRGRISEPHMASSESLCPDEATS